MLTFILLWIILNAAVMFTLLAVYGEPIRPKDLIAIALCLVFSFPVMFGVTLVIDKIVKWYERKTR